MVWKIKNYKTVKNRYGTDYRALLKISYEAFKVFVFVMYHKILTPQNLVKINLEGF